MMTHFIHNAELTQNTFYAFLTFLLISHDRIKPLRIITTALFNVILSITYNFTEPFDNIYLPNNHTHMYRLNCPIVINVSELIR